MITHNGKRVPLLLAVGLAAACFLLAFIATTILYAAFFMEAP